MGGWGRSSYDLPSFALSLMPMAQIARMMRSSMLEVLGQDYIKTARSKGLSKAMVILKHAVKNSILPIVSIMGTLVSNLLVGSFVIERIFGIPGLGKFFVTSIINRDYTLIMGTTVFYSIILVSMILIVDILYTLSIRESGWRRRDNMKQDTFQPTPSCSKSAARGIGF